MRRRVVLALLLSAVSCSAAEERVLPVTVSPDKQFSVVEVRAADGQRDYYFVHQPSRKRLGFVLPRQQRHQVRNVAIVASWNKSSTKVALLLFYGTKLSELLLHSRRPDGTFQEVSLTASDPLEIYQKRTGKTIPQRGDGFSENAVGPWLDDDTVMLVSGEAKQVLPPESETADEPLDHYTHVFVTFRAHIRGHSTTVSDLKLIGPLANAESEDFQKRWGHHYFSPHDL